MTIKREATEKTSIVGFCRYQACGSAASVAEGQERARTTKRGYGSKLNWEADLRVDLDRAKAWALVAELQRQLQEDNQEISVSLGGRFIVL